MIKKILWGLILIILTFYMYTFCKTSCMTFIYSNPYCKRATQMRVCSRPSANFSTLDFLESKKSLN